MQKICSVDDYIELNSHYAEELNILRKIINATELVETIKWNMPTYCLTGKNVLGIGAFKNHFCLWFHQGVYLKDKLNLLINAQENKTKGLRQMRFVTKLDINEVTVLAYVKEALENQHLGLEIKLQRNTKTLVIPEELVTALKSNKALNNSFSLLTKGKQREYCDYILEAKRETTKKNRLEKITPMIIKGAGLNDKYKNC